MIPYKYAGIRSDFISKILKMKSLTLGFVALALVASSQAFSLRKISFGTRASCPAIRTKTDFDIPKVKFEQLPFIYVMPQGKLQFQYTGVWYQVEGIASFFQPADTSCVKATYTQRDDLSVYVRNEGIYKNGQEYKDICGYAESTDSNNPGALKLHFPGTPEGDYWVLDTDYENFSAVYSCGTILGLVKLEYAFLLTRDAQPSEETVITFLWCQKLSFLI